MDITPAVTPLASLGGREKEKLSKEEAAVSNDIDKKFGSGSQATLSHVNDKASSKKSHAEAVAFDIDKPSNSKSHAEAIAFDNDKARRGRQEAKDIKERAIREA